MGICGNVLDVCAVDSKNGMNDLAGEYECKIDDKSRLKLPSALLKQLGMSEPKFVINRGYENYLMLCTEDVWDKKTNEINNLNIHLAKHREAMRYFYRGATKVNCDTADRILMPKHLTSWAGIDKEVVVFAFGSQIEIWAKDAYYQMLEGENKSFSELAEDVFGGKGANE